MLIDRLWENRSENVRWLESLGDLPSRLNAEAREEISSAQGLALDRALAPDGAEPVSRLGASRIDHGEKSPPEAGAGIETRPGITP